MLMVIFGAGASYDSSPTYPPGEGPPWLPARNDDFYRPPLAKDLFANRPLFIDALDRFPQCKAIVQRLRDPAVTDGRISIEARLQEIQVEAETYARGKQELAAVGCYLQRAIAHCGRQWRETTRGVTNQLALLREIARTNKNNEPVVLVTFNYDRMLEEALFDLGLEIIRMEDYTDRSRMFRLLKLHGSVDWGWEVDVQLPANLNATDPDIVLRYLVEHAVDVSVSDRLAICQPTAMGLAGGLPVFPAIAIPVEKKQIFQCPQFMIDELMELLPHVNKVMVIGWRATEEHFLRLLGAKLRRETYMSIVGRGRADADDIMVRITRALLNNPSRPSPESLGFTDYIQTGRARKILEADLH